MILEIFFAAGCFWGVEKNFENIDGVIDVVSGYSGGNYENPSYEDVLNNKLPPRETIADGRWVRKKTNWESELSGENLDRFNELNKTLLKQFGYL